MKELNQTEQWICVLANSDLTQKRLLTLQSAYAYIPFVFTVNSAAILSISQCKKMKLFGCCESNSTKKRNSKKGMYALQAYKKISKKDLFNFSLHKSRKSYQDKFTSEIIHSKLSEFIQCEPEVSVLYAEKQVERASQQAEEDYCYKKVKKSEYEELKLKYALSKDKYTDQEFPACQKSVGKDFHKQIVWKRIPDVIKNPKFIEDNVSPEDVFQGQLGNCYFLSAISALSENDFRIKNLFPSLKMNPNGFYMARIMFRGVYQEVVVDDYIPMGYNNHPLFAKPTKKNEIWVMILEKCWAKLFGSYEQTISKLYFKQNLGGFPHEVLHAFSSAPTFYHKIHPQKNKQQELFNLLFEEDSTGSVMCCGTIPEDHIIEFGLIKDHAYALLEVFKQPYKMIKLRNPWGNIEWKGRANNQDTMFWKSIPPYDQERLGYYHIQKNGTFFILWEDFVKFFKMVDVCSVNDNANYFFHEDTFIREKGKIFEIESKGGEVTIGVSQANLRGKILKEKGYSKAIIVLGEKVEKQKTKVISYKYVTSDSGKAFADFYLRVENLRKGSYRVYVEIQWIGRQKQQAVVSTYTDKIVTLSANTQDANAMTFLYQVYNDHACNNLASIQYISKDPLEYISYDLLINRCGYGYLMLFISKKSSKKIGMEFDEKQVFITNCDFYRNYEAKKLRLMEPYYGKGKFKIVAEPGKSVIVLYKVTDRLSNYPKEFSLPFPRVYTLVK